MAATADRVVQARINGQIKEEAAAALAAIGLTISDAVRLMLTMVAQEKTLPFDVSSMPNRATRKAMQDLIDGKGKTFDTAEDLFRHLGI